MILVSRLFIVAFFISLVSCNHSAVKTYVVNGYTQGTTYVVKYHHIDNVIKKEALDSLLKNIDLSMSSYIDSSIISLINQGKNIAPDSLLIQVLKRSIEICHETGGMFDVTVAPLVDYWGFGPDKKNSIHFQNIDINHDLIGCDKILLNGDDIIKAETTLIDLNGIAQGFTVDYLSQYLQKNKVYDFMIEVGGELLCSGDNLGSGWKIGIDEPTSSREKFSFILKLKNMALATSGSYRNYYYQDTIKISHTMNPKTLNPVNNKLISATVLYSDCMSADAYATACMSFGLERAKNFLNSNGISGCLMYIINGDTLAYLTPEFSSFLHWSPGSAPQ